MQITSFLTKRYSEESASEGKDELKPSPSNTDLNVKGKASTTTNESSADTVPFCVDICSSGWTWHVLRGWHPPPSQHDSFSGMTPSRMMGEKSLQRVHCGSLFQNTCPQKPLKVYQWSVCPKLTTSYSSLKVGLKPSSWGAWSGPHGSFNTSQST